MTTPKTTTRMERGICHFRERGHEIREVEPGVYRVPASEGGGFYRVDLDRERCECADRALVCKHQFAATIFAAKKKCRRGSTTTRPQRRHGVQRPAQERSGSNRKDQRRSSDIPGSGSVGFGYGVGKATVLGGLDRVGSRTRLPTPRSRRSKPRTSWPKPRVSTRRAAMNSSRSTDGTSSSSARQRWRSEARSTRFG